MMGYKVFYAPDVDGSGNGVAPENAQETTVVDSGTNGVTYPAWMAQLPNELKTDQELANYPTISSMIKGLREAKATESKPKEVKYENFAKKFDEISDPLGKTGEFFKGKFEKFGVSQKDAEAFFDEYAEAQKSYISQIINEHKDIYESNLKASWGKDYDSNRRYMQMGYKALGDTDGSLQAKLDQSGVSMTPTFAEVLMRIGKLVKEDTSVGNKTKATVTRNSSCPIDYSKPTDRR